MQKKGRDGTVMVVVATAAAALMAVAACFAADAEVEKQTIPGEGLMAGGTISITVRRRNVPLSDVFQVV